MKSNKLHGHEGGFLGYGLYPSKDGIKLRIHSEHINKMKAKVKELTARSDGHGYEEVKRKLKQAGCVFFSDYYKGLKVQT